MVNYAGIAFVLFVLFFPAVVAIAQRIICSVVMNSSSVVSPITYTVTKR